MWKLLHIVSLVSAIWLFPNIIAADQLGPITGAPGGGSRTFQAALESASFDGFDDGGQCLDVHNKNTPGTCGAAYSSAEVTVPFVNGITVSTCTVGQYDMTDWDNAGGSDIMVLQIKLINTTNFAATNLGDPFTIVNPTTGCVGAPNCMDTIGSYTWTVDGYDAMAQGAIGVEVDAPSLDQDGDAHVELIVTCDYRSGR